MISVSSISMNYGERMLFDNVNVTFHQGERYGLTGPNGAGKSTFMKILSGDQEPSSGFVQRPRRLGILRQDHYGHESDKIIDVVVMGNRPLWDALAEKAQLIAKPDVTNEEGMRLGELEGIIAEEDGYMAESEAATLLEGLGIPEALHEEPLSVLQGGDKVRVLLAQALFGKPDGLLLDEPTNALDDANRLRMLDLLAGLDVTMVIVSHDRPALERLATRAVVLQGGRLQPATIHRHPSPTPTLHIHGLDDDHRHELRPAGGLGDGEATWHDSSATEKERKTGEDGHARGRDQRRRDAAL